MECINHKDGLSSRWSGFSSPHGFLRSLAIMMAEADLLTRMLASLSWLCSAMVSWFFCKPAIRPTDLSGRGPAGFSLSGGFSLSWFSCHKDGVKMPSARSFSSSAHTPSSRKLVGLGGTVSTEQTRHPRVTSCWYRSFGRKEDHVGLSLNSGRMRSSSM